MSLLVLLVIAALTYGSRALALVFMPDPPEPMKAILDRIPAPLFAGIAVSSLISGGELAPPEMLTAAGVALVATPTRSLLWVLVAGLVGYSLGIFLFAN